MVSAHVGLLGTIIREYTVCGLHHEALNQSFLISAGRSFDCQLIWNTQVIGPVQDLAWTWDLPAMKHEKPCYAKIQPTNSIQHPASQYKKYFSVGATIQVHEVLAGPSRIRVETRGLSFMAATGIPCYLLLEPWPRRAAPRRFFGNLDCVW